MSNKDVKFMKLAYSVADIFSKDRSTKVGAVIVGQEGEILSVGYNGFCRGYDDEEPANHERPKKYLVVEHAERNAIYNAARVGARLIGSTVYVSSLPTCIECTKAIVQAGIKTVVLDADSLTSKRWTEHWELSKDIYRQCSVSILLIPNLDLLNTDA